MARIRWDGKIYNAEPVRQLDGGDWIMRVLEHGPRFSPGTEVRVLASDVVEMSTAPVARPALIAGLAQLEADMAAERQTLPSVQQVIASGAPIAHDAPDKVVSVRPDPM